MSTDISTTALGLGLDIGSVALKCVLTDAEGRLLEHTYTRTQGRPVETALAVLGQLLAERPEASFELVAGTGSGARLVCQLLGVPCLNEVICQATALRRLHREVRSVIEMGGQDSKIIFLPADPTDARPMLDFAMNTNCAAGTGSFLDQQASRLGLRIEGEFGQLALKSANPPRVAGRCSVFAKSDMIHLQQLGAPVHDIVAGLCLGLARNLKSNLAGGRELPLPIAFCGGVAANAGVVHALEEVFDLGAGGLIVPECHAATGALGAVLVALQEREREGGPREGPKATFGRPMDGRIDLTPLRKYLADSHSIGHRLASLARPQACQHAHGGGDRNSSHNGNSQAHHGNGQHGNGQAQTNGQSHRATGVQVPAGPVDAWLGLDVGSISTKVAVIDAQNRVLAKIYLMTAGRPLDAVRRVLREIGQQVAALPFPVVIRGAATTGSGRYLTGDIIGADLVINEITAQATAAAALDSAVDTIFEIGGQDSKYIALDRGVVVDFEMNHACAAGTGSFLEEQAERLGVSIKGQFAELAFQSAHPIRLGERCTVFMESDLLSHQQQGAPTADLVGGLCYSIVSNYINRVVGHRKIGNRIFFQGGTAFNKGVVAAFEAVTGRPIIVPDHHEVTGAIGAAVLARGHMAGKGPSRFGGFALADLQCEVRSFECTHCSNLCEINEVTVPGRDALYYGSRCDRYNLKKDRAKSTPIPNLFAERQRLLFKHAHLPAGPAPAGKTTVGLPLALANLQLLPFWGTLLGEMGLHAVVSLASDQEIIGRGVEAVLSTPCFPVKVAHGHVLALLDRNVDYLFLPSVVTLRADYPENKFHQLCPYVTGLPYQVASALKAQGRRVPTLAPRIFLDKGPRRVVRDLLPLARQFKVSRGRLAAAVEKAWQAQDAFEEACRIRGREVLEKLDPGVRPIVIISRPYNGCDTAVSLDLPNKLRRLNVLPIPMDFLDLTDPAPSGDRVLQNMYWKYGQRILRAGKLIRRDARLHAIYLSNFSCGPDSFLISFFKRLMAPKPSLVLEIDEHSADAGVVTRLEAFLESLHHATAAELPRPLPLYPDTPLPDMRARTLYIPWMSDISHCVAAAFRGCGINAQVMPVADAGALELGRRHCSGKECLPCLITAGDMLKAAASPNFDKARSAFFMPSGCGPCRFGQYNALHRMLLTDAGLGDVPILSPSDDSGFYDEWRETLGDTDRPGWVALCAGDVLGKARLALRPYEKNAGQTDALYGRALDEVCRLAETRPPERAMVALLRRLASEFAALPADRASRRPKIAIIGEIYVRLHSTANDHLVRQLESLGAEVDLASFPEYMYYTNWTRRSQAVRDRTWRLWVANFLKDRVQRGIHRRINAPFRRLLGPIDEPGTASLVRLAGTCVDPAFEAGETVLSIAKTLEVCHHGYHGVVNVMPFSCMPSTLAGGMMKTLADIIGRMPTLSISYDGQQDPTLRTRLEAFLYQARTYQETGRAGEPSSAAGRRQRDLVPT